MESGGFILSQACVVGNVVGRSHFVVGRKFSCCKGSQEMCCWEVGPVTGT
nr:hypothetical protein [Prochlorococcus marinus]